MLDMSSQHAPASSTFRSASWPGRRPRQSPGISSAASTHVWGAGSSTGVATGVGLITGAGAGVGSDVAQRVRFTMPEVQRTPSPRAHAGTGDCATRSSAIHLSQHTRDACKGSALRRRNRPRRDSTPSCCIGRGPRTRRPRLSRVNEELRAVGDGIALVISGVFQSGTPRTIRRFPSSAARCPPRTDPHLCPAVTQTCASHHRPAHPARNRRREAWVLVLEAALTVAVRVSVTAASVFLVGAIGQGVASRVLLTPSSTLPPEDVRNAPPSRLHLRVQCFLPRYTVRPVPMIVRWSSRDPYAHNLQLSPGTRWKRARVFAEIVRQLAITLSGPPTRKHPGQSVKGPSAKRIRVHPPP